MDTKTILFDKETIDNAEVTGEFENFETEKAEPATPAIDLNKTTTKGLRITERTKIRYNTAEKASGLSQEEFANRLLDMCDFFEGSDLSKTPELAELTNIVNRIPEIFMALISKQKTYESGLVTKHANKIDSLTAMKEEAEQKYNELKETSKEEYDKLNTEYEKLKAQSELKIKEQDIALDKANKENEDAQEQISNLKKNLELTKEKLDVTKEEQFKNKEKLQEKTDEVNDLKNQVQELKSELLNIKQEKMDVDLAIAEQKKQADYYKMQLETTESNLEQQKKMYQEQLEHYKKIIDTK